MWAGKKTAGKKNKFWVGRFSFIQFALEENLIFVTSLAALHITEKVFAKGGLNWTKSSISTERSKLLFQIVKLQKNTI